MQCHKCRWNDRLGEFADRPWDEVPCANCEYFPDLQTRYVMPYNDDAIGDPDFDDAAPEPKAGAVPPEHWQSDQSVPWSTVDAFDVSEAAVGAAGTAGTAVAETGAGSGQTRRSASLQGQGCDMPGPEIMEALGRVVDLLLRLTTKQHVVLRLRLAGKSFKEIGTELEISGNAAEKVFGHLLRARPLLRSLFPRRVVRGTRRRAAGLHPAELCRGEG